MIGDSLQSKYEKAASVICRQGIFPFPVNETTLTILRRAVGDVGAELDLIAEFDKKASQTLAELMDSSGMPEETVVKLTNSLARKGLLFNQPNTGGTMVYRLLPLMMVGLMEYTFMGPLQWNDREKELAVLFQRLMDDVRDQVQENYDAFVPIFNISPPIDRTVPARITEDGKTIRVIPVNKNIEGAGETVLPSQSIDEIIEKFDEIAVGHCFCRQRRALLGEPCTTDAPLENCFTFGKSARHTASQGFARMITREEALRIMREAETTGLVHKALSSQFQGGPARNQYLQLLQGLLRHPSHLAGRGVSAGQRHFLSLLDRPENLHRMRHLRRPLPYRGDPAG